MLTRSAIKDMGYSEYPLDDVLVVRFGVIRVFSLQGVFFDKSCDETLSKKVCFGRNCTVVISESINDACELLTGDVFVDDEEHWISVKEAKPPFVLMYFQESVDRVLEGGFRQVIDNDIYTYNGFPKGKLEIRAWDKKVMPSIAASLTVRFSDSYRDANLVPVVRSVFGITAEGQTLFDLKSVFSSLKLIASYPKTTGEIDLLLDGAVEVFASLNEKVSRKFYMALNERDRFKQFLYYYLFIEIFTHSQYKDLAINDGIDKLLNVPDRLQKSGEFFLKSGR